MKRALYIFLAALALALIAWAMSSCTGEPPTPASELPYSTDNPWYENGKFEITGDTVKWSREFDVNDNVWAIVSSTAHKNSHENVAGYTVELYPHGVAVKVQKFNITKDGAINLKELGKLEIVQKEWGNTNNFVVEFAPIQAELKEIYPSLEVAFWQILNK